MKRPTNRALKLLLARLEDRLFLGTEGELPEVLSKIDQVKAKMEAAE